MELISLCTISVQFHNLCIINSSRAVYPNQLSIFPHTHNFISSNILKTTHSSTTTNVYQSEIVIHFPTTTHIIFLTTMIKQRENPSHRVRFSISCNQMPQAALRLRGTLPNKSVISNCNSDVM